jgi:hypothetical protein
MNNRVKERDILFVNVAKVSIAILKLDRKIYKSDKTQFKEIKTAFIFWSDYGI